MNTLDGNDGGKVIRAVSESLRRLVQSGIKELSSDSAVVFESPGEIDNQGETRLSLYLYQSNINPYLRNLPGRLTANASASGHAAGLTMESPPLVVDLVYLMVPYAKSGELELVLIDKLFQLFHNVSELSGQWLHPALTRSGNTAIDIVPDHSSSDKMRNIWMAFPNKPYKFTLLYTLSPVRIPAARDTSVDMVTDGQMQFGDLQ